MTPTTDKPDETPHEQPAEPAGSDQRARSPREYPETWNGLQNVLQNRFSPRHWRERFRNGRPVG